MSDDPSLPGLLVLFDLAVNASRILGLVVLAAFALGIVLAPVRHRAVMAIGGIVAAAGLVWVIVPAALGGTSSPLLADQARAAAIRAVTEPLVRDATLAIVTGVVLLLAASIWGWWQGRTGREPAADPAPGRPAAAAVREEE